MEKLISVPDSPRIEVITSALVLQQEAKIFADSFDGKKYEIYFPNIYDFRQCVEAAFISRKFESDADKQNFAVRTVENSDWIRSFIRSSCGVYGEKESDFIHYILFDSIDTIIEIIATKPPVISEMALPEGYVRIADLVRCVCFSAVREKLRLHYGERELPRYAELYYMLEQRACSYVRGNDFTIYIAAIRAGDEDDEVLDEFDENDAFLDFDVGACVPDEEFVYSITAHSYDDFLGCMVGKETLKKFSPEAILAHCLYEITAYGFEDNV